MLRRGEEKWEEEGGWREELVEERREEEVWREGSVEEKREEESWREEFVEERWEGWREGEESWWTHDGGTQWGPIWAWVREWVAEAWARILFSRLRPKELDVP